MAFDIDKLARMGQFSLDLKSLGRIRCLSLTTDLLSEARRRINSPEFVCKDFVRWLLGAMARRPSKENFQDDDPIDGEALKPEELESVTDEDLGVFAKRLVQTNAFLVKTHKGKDLERSEEQSACDFLVDAFKHHQSEEKNQRDRLFKSVSKPLFAESTLDSIRRSLDASSQLEDSIKKYAGISSVFDSTFAQPIASPRLHELTFPTSPPNPIHETNQILGDLTTQIQDMRPLVAQGAELIRSMNDTALRMQADYIGNATKTERQTKLAIGIAAAGFVASAIGLVISSVFSYLSYTDAKGADKKSEAQIAAFQAATEKLVREQKEEMSALVKTIAAGRRNPKSPEVKK